jgi:hypothetical protein
LSKAILGDWDSDQIPCQHCGAHLELSSDKSGEQQVFHTHVDLNFAVIIDPLKQSPQLYTVGLNRRGNNL